ncbi:MAG: YvcK family protein [Symbiobacteriaceae bacterium]|nr:YvcK family protein [Symbiobacteriaceae bacterium]
MMELWERLLAALSISSGHGEKFGPRIVVIGGGTGLAMLLRGLKNYSSNLTAIVTVGDDGGSSGRLRQDLGVLPPGDIRNCLVALSDAESLLTQLFDYRFPQGEGLAGHNFGNLFLAALTEVMAGDFLQAVQACSRVLAVRGQVLPATLQQVTLVAEYDDGTVLRGESLIGRTPRRIHRLRLDPPAPEALPEARQAIAEADAIILGPGSLYTSIIPNLQMQGMVQEIQRSPATAIYVCNIMTQPGETTEHSAADHLQALLEHSQPRLVEYMLVNEGEVSKESRELYAVEGGAPVVVDRERLTDFGIHLVTANLIAPGTVVRHDSVALAQALLDIIARERYTLRRRRALVRQLQAMQKG